MIGLVESRLRGGSGTPWGDDFVFKVKQTVRKTFYLCFLNVGGVFDFIVDWGDGSSENITSYISNKGHVYPAGEYIVRINGSCPHIYFATSPNYDVTELLNWGNIGLLSCKNMFNYCKNFQYLPDMPIPNIENVSDFSSMFQFSSLSSIPTGLLDNAISMTSAASMFYYIRENLIIPPNLLVNSTLLTNAYAMFAHAYVSSIPTSLFVNCPDLADIRWCFGYNSGLQYVDDDLFRGNSKINSCQYTFQYCDLLTLPDMFNPTDHPLMSNFNNAFRFNNNATGNAPEYWLRWPALSSTYTNSCFRNDILLNNYASIPIAWK